jgi:hypothetical protein
MKLEFKTFLSTIFTTSRVLWDKSNDVQGVVQRPSVLYFRYLNTAGMDSRLRPGRPVFDSRQNRIFPFASGSRPAV